MERKHLDSVIKEKGQESDQKDTMDQRALSHRVLCATALQQAPGQRLEEQMVMVCSVIHCN